MDVNNVLVENLNKIVKENGLKQRHIAELAHMDERKISAILTGRQKNIGCIINVVVQKNRA